MTPSGTPVVTKPMKSGTAEQEQNGVTMPRRAASTLPTDSRLPARTRRVRSGVKNDRTMPDAEDDQRQEQQDLRRLVEEELDRGGERGPALEAEAPKVNQEAAAARRE